MAMAAWRVGKGDKWTLELLLAAAPWIGGSRSLQDKKLTTQIVAAEMVLKGCTAAYDLYYEFPMPSATGSMRSPRRTTRSAWACGRGPHGRRPHGLRGHPGLYDALPTPLQARVDKLRLPAWERTVDACVACSRNWRWNGKDIRAAVAPTIPHHCSDAFLCGCRDLAREYKVGLHSHVGESKVQALVGIKRYGKTLVQHMDSLALIGPDFTAAHAIWLDDDDLKIMRDRGASMAHNPGSNMRLGNGMFRFRRARDVGVNVGLGTDGANCSDNQNMYEAMRYASMLSKVQTPDPRYWAGVEEVYTAATQGSARALGFSDIGAIAPGMKADIVFLDLASINWIPHNWSVNQVVHTEDGTGVRHVMIGGRFVVQDRRLLTLDLAKLAVEAEAARERLEALNAEFKDLYESSNPWSPPSARLRGAALSPAPVPLRRAGLRKRTMKSST